MWKFWQARKNAKRIAQEMYARIVERSRAPVFYTQHGVPDTPEGRYELVVLHLALANARLMQIGGDGNDIARALNERFVVDMDDNLREMGVGDLTVPKKVKKAAAGLLERATGYSEAAEQGREALDAVLATHLGPNVFAGVDIAALTQYYLTNRSHLAGQSDAALLQGKLEFAAQAHAG